MTSDELRKKFIDFFVERGHKEIQNVSLVPEHDPTVLFTTAGMHPLVPYLLGETHPQGARLVNIQRCLRTDDIEEVGDATHNTFFEMLGNWSLGDYWKEEAIGWSFEFLTKELNIPVEKLAVSVFAGDEDAPVDRESIEIWKKLGIPDARIARLPKKDNWWGPAGLTGPCGPDTEMFYWNGKDEAPINFDPQDSNWVEIWNDVFMEYYKIGAGKYEPLKQKNVDTGMGMERMLMILNGKESVYETDVFSPLMDIAEGNKIFVDHIRSAIMLIADGVQPSNKDRGYILRRLIRRAMVKAKSSFVSETMSHAPSVLIEPMVTTAADIYKDRYPHVIENKNKIIEILNEETEKFSKTLERGLREIEKVNHLDGEAAFHLYESYGFPFELTEEIARERGQLIEKGAFEKEFKKHQELSRQRSAGKFAGGLADHSEATIRGHTATHLLHQVLRDVLGPSVHQTGSNITPVRIRFDFSFNRKLTPREIKKVQEIVNQKVKENLSVHFEIIPLEKAKKINAIGLFDEKYGDQVKIYFVGDYSVEFCGGPHVDTTSQVGQFIIEKETAAGAGSRRIYARLD